MKEMAEASMVKVLYSTDGKKYSDEESINIQKNIRTSLAIGENITLLTSTQNVTKHIISGNEFEFEYIQNGILIKGIK